MYALKNKVQLIGNLGKSPEIKNASNGNKMAKLAIATNETYKSKNGDTQTLTTWHNVVAWGKPAEIAEKYLAKGKEVAIEGKLTNRSYTDTHGVKRYITEIVASQILIIGNKNTASLTPSVQPVAETNFDDLPF